MKNFAIALVCVIALVVVLALQLRTATAATPTGATYDVWARGMIAEKCRQYDYVCNSLTTAYVQQIGDGNAWWLKPLHERVNAKFPKYAPPLSLDELTRYAIVRAWGLAVEAKDACEKGVIRDFQSRGKYPTANDLKHCDKPNQQDWWVSQYANNVEQTRADFDTAPEVFKVNEWAERRFWRASREYGWQ